MTFKTKIAASVGVLSLAGLVVGCGDYLWENARVVKLDDNYTCIGNPSPAVYLLKGKEMVGTKQKYNGEHEKLGASYQFADKSSASDTVSRLDRCGKLLEAGRFDF